ncbi:MAG: hypothetical protein NTW65_10845 [Deltaproteobacteria bacterium]|nr:hypothetical protein [Deltaproteobacteria bacterium]
MIRIKESRRLPALTAIVRATFSVCAFAILLTQSFTAYAAEGYKGRKILLGTFTMGEYGGKNDSYGVHWDMVRTSHVSVAKNHSIFILDRMGKRVLQFEPDGKIVREILLQGADFYDRSEELGDDGYIPYQLYVSGSGSRLYTSGNGSADNWTVYDLSGRPIRKNVRVKKLEKTCKGSFVANDGRQYMNDSLEVTKLGLAPAHRDVEGNIISVMLQRKKDSKASIIKKTKEGHEVWKKDLMSYGEICQIVGLDGEGNIYLLVNARTKILKLNKDGKETGIITFPSDPFFKDGRFLSFQVICDGTIYVVPSYFTIWHSNKGDKTKTMSYWLYEFSQH